MADQSEARPHSTSISPLVRVLSELSSLLRVHHEGMMTDYLQDLFCAILGYVCMLRAYTPHRNITQRNQSYSFVQGSKLMINWSHKRLDFWLWKFQLSFIHFSGLKVSDQMVAYATRFLPVHLKNHVWSHHRALKTKVQCDFSSADYTNVLLVINIDITQPGTKK